jgi:glycosyltransferase involved in cell wall biosynthesis
MSDLEKAVELYKVLVKRFPQNIEIQKKFEELKQMTAELNQVDNYLDEIIALPEKTKETIKPILDKVPKHLRAHPKLLIIQNEYFRKEQSSGKDLAIYCPQTSFEWTPENTKTGIGGSEEAVIRLAPELQKLGWLVTVYNACGLRGYEQAVEGFKPVIWRPFWEFNPRDKWDILISWRHPILFQFKELNAGRRYVWMHDVLPKQEFTTERLANINKVIVLSKFQRSLFPNIPDAKIMISGNGIIKEQFDTNIIREPYRLIYTSAPDRGLECLVKNIFPLIKKEIREAKLYWFYGWQTFDAIQAEDQKQIAWAESLRHLIKQTTDVIDGDRIGHRELAQEYQKSDIWIYPTMFPEIFCLSAVKAQQGGAVPIVNVMTEVNGQKQKSSLDEVIMDDCGVKTYFDNLYQDGEQQKKFAEIVVKNLKIRKELEKYRERGQLIYQKYNWKLIARQWTDEFQS